MTDDAVMRDIQRTLEMLYEENSDDRTAYHAAVGAKADEKGMPPNVKETFVDLAMEVYDKMKGIDL